MERQVTETGIFPNHISTKDMYVFRTYKELLKTQQLKQTNPIF